MNWLIALQTYYCYKKILQKIHFTKMQIHFTENVLEQVGKFA